MALLTRQGLRKTRANVGEPLAFRAESPPILPRSGLSLSPLPPAPGRSGGPSPRPSPSSATSRLPPPCNDMQFCSIKRHKDGRRHEGANLTARVKRLNSTTKGPWHQHPLPQSPRHLEPHPTS